MARVDVIIPCYRYAHFLRACAQSALSQSGVDVRVLIIDDASPDDTAEVAARLAAEDSRVEFRRHRVNQGHIATYNEGLAWANGDYVLLLSADDGLTDGALSRAAKLMDAHCEIGMTYGRAIYTSAPFLDDWQAPATYGWRVMSGPEFLRAMCSAGENTIPTPTAIVRTRVQKAIGGYRKELPHSGDMEMWLRCAAHGSIGVLDVEQAYYRLHRSSMSNSFTGLRDLRARQAAFQTLFDQYGPGLAESQQLQRCARRAVAGHAFWTASHLFDAGDLAACQQFLAYALDLDPALCWRPQCLRFRCKQMLGPRLWSSLRPLVGRLRRSFSVPARVG